VAVAGDSAENLRLCAQHVEASSTSSSCTRPPTPRLLRLSTVTRRGVPPHCLDHGMVLDNYLATATARNPSLTGCSPPTSSWRPRRAPTAHRPLRPAAHERAYAARLRSRGDHRLPLARGPDATLSSPCRSSRSPRGHGAATTSCASRSVASTPEPPTPPPHDAPGDPSPSPPQSQVGAAAKYPARNATKVPQRVDRKGGTWRENW